MPKLCFHAKAVATVAAITGAGAMAYLGYHCYKNWLQHSDKTDEECLKTHEEDSELQVNGVEPPRKPDLPEPQAQSPKIEDKVPQPAESFVLLPSKEPEPISEPQVDPPTLLGADSIPQPAESFVLLPPKELDDKPQTEFDPSVDTIAVKSNDENNDNSFIKVSIGKEDDEEKSPQKLDLSDLPLPIQKLDELANLPQQLEEKVKQLADTLPESGEHLEESFQQ